MEWISVKDKLPDDKRKKWGVRVYCYYLNYQTDKRKFYNQDILSFKNGIFFYGLNCVKEVYYWMPLLKTPKIRRNERTTSTRQAKR